MSAPFQVMPPLSPEEYAELREDIRQNGIIVPILYDLQDRVIDGHHRLAIAAELGIDSDDIPYITMGGTDAELRAHAYRLNLQRRHLTREDRRWLIIQMRAEGMKQQDIAEAVGVSQQTVSNVIRDVTKTGNADLPETITDSLGREQPATKPPRERIEPAPAPDVEEPEPDPSVVSSPSFQRPEPEPEPEGPTVEEFLADQPAVQDASYVAAFLKALGRADDVLRFDASRLADLLDDGETRLLDRYTRSFTDFITVINRRRHGLRVVKGAAQ